MKILMTTDTAGGVWTYTRELARGLEEHGVEVTLAAMGPREPEEDVQWRPFALEWMPDPWEDVARAGDWLLELRDELSPDLVHLNGYAHAALDWGLPVVCVAHSDVLSWFEAVRAEPAPPEWRRYREAVEAGLEAADVVVSPTHAQLDSLERHYGFQSERVVIANGLRPIDPAPKRPVVAAAGRAWDEAKNLRALELVDVAWPVEAADGTRPRSEVVELLASAAVFAEPARYEPFGLAALEAATAGCALVLGDIPSLREVWGDAALFVDPDDSRGLERALGGLIADERLREDYASRARTRGLEYSVQRMAQAYVALYDRLPARIA